MRLLYRGTPFAVIELLHRLPRTGRGLSLGSLIVLLTLAGGVACRAQAPGPRVWDRNAIFWGQSFGTIRLTERWAVHAEYQLRRAGWVSDPKQHLVRGGLTFQLSDQVLLRGGYAFIQTYIYGDYPLQAAGLPFPEHRTFQMVQLADKFGKVGISHRFMLEQRWVGRYRNTDDRTVDEWPATNRVRYMLRVQRGLRWPNWGAGPAYVAAFDEILINFGRNVGINLLDQNRLGAVIGGAPIPGIRLEGGFFMQTLQVPRLIEGRNVWQQNMGPVLSAFWTIDARPRHARATPMRMPAQFPNDAEPRLDQPPVPGKD